MIKITNAEVVGLEHAIRGMRNPMNSWEKSDSEWIGDKNYELKVEIGPNDHDLMMRLAKGGSVHAKYRRMIVVYVDIEAPLYWWKEFDTYKVGTVANSCSTMHKIHAKEFTLEDFSYEHLMDWDDAKDTFCYIPYDDDWLVSPIGLLDKHVRMLNICRQNYLDTKDKKYWWQMIQLLPSSYNQRRTVMLNYEVLAGIYTWRKDHKLDEWREFCRWIEQLPYSEIITAKPEEKEITGWRPISEYNRENYDWVLVKCFDVCFECIPMIAELRSDGYWHTAEETIIPFENVRYFFDMKQLDSKESEG